MVLAARNMKRALEIKLNEYGVTSSQYTVLELLWKYNGLSLSELGKSLNFDNPTITGIVSRMARANLLRRTRDRNDRRIIKVHLTQKGLDLKAILPKIADEVNMKAVEDFHENDKKNILEFARRIHQNLKNNEQL